MKRFLVLILFTFFTNFAFADAIDDAKTVMQTLSGKVLTNGDMISIATKYGQAHSFSNPWSATYNPTEYAAWPTNLELAAHFVTRVRKQIRLDIGRVAGEAYDATNISARDAAVLTAQDEL